MQENSLKGKLKVTNISVKKLHVEKLNVEAIDSSNFDIAEEEVESFNAGNPNTKQSELKQILLKTKGEIQLALFNPMLEVKLAVVQVQNRHKKVLADLNEKLTSLSIPALQKKYQELFEDDDFVNYLTYLHDSLFDGEIEWDCAYPASNFLLELYLILSRGTIEQRVLLQDLYPDVYQFVTNLIQNKIAEPYLLWTLTDDAEEYFNRYTFNVCHDSRVLAVNGNVLDMGAEPGFVLPTEFKPLSDVSPDYIYNIESGLFALTNNLVETSDLSEIGFEVMAGAGDGYYPTIPFFDHFGELQMLTTFFTHMISAEWLDSRLDSMGQKLFLYAHQVPLEMGYLDCDGSFFFGDSTWFHNGPGDDLIVEFSDLPVDRYLVVRFIDVDSEKQTWAVSVMRDKAKRNFEILFKIFPELTKRNDDF